MSNGSTTEDSTDNSSSEENLQPKQKRHRTRTSYRQENTSSFEYNIPSQVKQKPSKDDAFKSILHFLFKKI